MLGALAVMHFAALGDNQRFAGFQVAHDGEPLRFQRDRLAGNHVFMPAVFGVAHAVDNRADGERVAEGDETVAANHRNHGIRAAHAAVGGGDGVEDDFRRGPQLLLALDFVGEDVEQRFGIRMRVDVAQVALVNGADELVGVGEIAVVGKRDAVGRVHIERLRFGGARSAGGRVAHMADAVIADKTLHLALAENIAHETVVLVQEKAPVRVAGGNTGGVLAAMLQDGQRVIQRLVYKGFAHNAHNAAHT